MTGKEFLIAVSNGRVDVVELLLSLLRTTASDYCVIGGLAVNAYTEPVVSLDLGVVVVADHADTLVAAARAAGMRVEEHAHGVNLSITGSGLRVRLQTDPRYQDFLTRAELRQVLGYEVRVAALEDVLRGKLWAHADERRRKSKRQKVLADILRLVEAHPSLRELLPGELRDQVD